ncbi:predicted transcriptional regulator containing the HTH domain [Serpentinimonas raichei]|uniref:Predicted transcriptional regulator containing the HTH domain n=2 Tax=Serpentinimonas raichei TaxID=1458425 RepID=A0A060NI12_9BURK|nr:predicted transcriptional regulator containing the HTH domain [Serpentinimonas raichei]
MAMNPVALPLLLEAVLLCAPEPVSLQQLGAVFEGEVAPAALEAALHGLQQSWSERGLELVQVGPGWCFRSRAEVRPYLERLHPEKPPKYSRAVLETLAIVAYRQPVTRGEMEDLRGVSIHSGILKQLEARGWIEVVGQRQTPGRPALYATTPQFLRDLALPSLAELPLVPAAAEPMRGSKETPAPRLPGFAPPPGRPAAQPTPPL